MVAPGRHSFVSFLVGTVTHKAGALRYPAINTRLPLSAVLVKAACQSDREAGGRSRRENSQDSRYDRFVLPRKQV